MSAAQVLYAVHDIKNGDPTGWREGFRMQGHFQLNEAEKFAKGNESLASAQAYMGAAYAFRASLQYADPTADDFDERVKEMEDAFKAGTALLGVPMRPVEVPFEDIALPGYFLEHDDRQRPTLMMVGGGGFLPHRYRGAVPQRVWQRAKKSGMAAEYGYENNQHVQ